MFNYRRVKSLLVPLTSHEVLGKLKDPNNFFRDDDWKSTV